MTDLLNCLVALPFAQADAPAAPTVTALPPAPLPDTADVAAFPALKGGAVVGLSLSSAPVSGDTVSAQVFKNGVAVSGASVQVTNAAPNASAIFSKDTAANQFVGGDLLSVRYQTTSGGTYSVHDVAAVLLIQYGLSE